MVPLAPMGSFICEDQLGETTLPARILMKAYFNDTTSLGNPIIYFVICIYRSSRAPWETRHQKVPVERNQSKQLCLKESQVE